MHAPRVTEQELNDNIVHTAVVKHVSVSGQILRWAVLTTKNGFSVTGKPAVAVSSANDDEDLASRLAINNAKSELWSLMGYNLKQRLFEQQASEGSSSPAVCENGSS